MSLSEVFEIVSDQYPEDMKLLIMITIVSIGCIVLSIMLGPYSDTGTDGTLAFCGIGMLVAAILLFVGCISKANEYKAALEETTSSIVTEETAPDTAINGEPTANEETAPDTAINGEPTANEETTPSITTEESIASDDTVTIHLDPGKSYYIAVP